jgi:hypothetical protein
MGRRAAALALLVPGAVATGNSYREYEERLRWTVNTLLAVTQQPWTMVQNMAGWYDSGVLRDIYDERNWSTARTNTFVNVRILQPGSTTAMLYAGFEDGSFQGYYTWGASSLSVNDSAVYTETRGCAWNYTAACGGDGYCAAG